VPRSFCLCAVVDGGRPDHQRSSDSGQSPGAATSGEGLVEPPVSSSRSSILSFAASSACSQKIVDYSQDTGTAWAMWPAARSLDGSERGREAARSRTYVRRVRPRETAHGVAQRVMPLSSLRPCLCPCTSGTRPPDAPRTSDRARSSIPDTRDMHPPRGRVAFPMRYAQPSFRRWLPTALKRSLVQDRAPAPLFARYPPDGAAHIPRSSLLAKLPSVRARRRRRRRSRRQAWRFWTSRSRHVRTS